MSKPVKIILGLIVSAGCLWFVFRGFDFNQLGQSLRNAAYIWMLPAAFLFIFNMSLRTLRWKTLLSPVKVLTFPQVFPVLLFGFFMNNILPARGGELVRAVTADKKTGVPFSSAMGSIVVERLTDMIGLLMTLILAAKLLPWDKLPIKPIVGVILAGVIGGLVLVALMQKYGERYKSKPGIVGKVVTFISHVLDGFLALRSPAKMLTVVSLSCFIWINEILMAMLVSYAMHLKLSFFESAGLITGISVGVMIPAAPGYIGTYEFFGKQILVMLGHAPDVSLACVLVLHFFQLAMMALLGIPSMMKVS